MEDHRGAWRRGVERRAVRRGGRRAGRRLSPGGPGAEERWQEIPDQEKQSGCTFHRKPKNPKEPRACQGGGSGGWIRATDYRLPGIRGKKPEARIYWAGHRSLAQRSRAWLADTTAGVAWAVTSAVTTRIL
jgi:hypothetical protein